MVYHVHNAHTIVFMYNAWIKALSLCPIEPRERKQYSASDHTTGHWQLRRLTDNWNSETLHGSGAVILVTQSRWAPMPRTHTKGTSTREEKHLHWRQVGQQHPQQLHKHTNKHRRKENKGNRVGQSLDPDNTLGELWHSLQWQQAQERQPQQQRQLRQPPPQTHKKTWQASAGTSWSHHSTMVTMEHLRTWDSWTTHTQGYYKHQRQQQQNSQTHNCELQQTQSRMEKSTYKWRQTSGTSSPHQHRNKLSSNCLQTIPTQQRLRDLSTTLS